MSVLDDIGRLACWSKSIECDVAEAAECAKALRSFASTPERREELRRLGVVDVMIAAGMRDAADANIIRNALCLLLALISEDSHRCAMVAARRAGTMLEIMLKKFAADGEVVQATAALLKQLAAAEAGGVIGRLMKAGLAPALVHAL